MNEFLQFNNRQHLPSNGCHFALQQGVEVSAGFGDHDTF